MNMDGKVALVTGSTSGIGRATAVALAGRGAHVLVTGRNQERAGDVVDTIRNAGGKADFLQATLSGVESARALASQAVDAGGGHIDILINNAGFAVGGPTQTTTEAEFDQTYGLNVKVPFFLVAELAPPMAERGSGAIVNITTMVAGFGQPGMAVYGSSRAALELLTKSWAAEFGPRGVRVNAVSPGPVRTPMSEAMGDMPDQMAALAPAGRVAAPEELAAAIVYLASDDATFVQGVILPVDGGRAAT
jgi:NAD(P)-dependent dehydrogenase (short-subunit alcohol dehydrogenase family)